MRYTIVLMPFLLACLGRAQTRAHIEASITINLEATPSVVLPLFGPVRETEWDHGWSPEIIYPSDGGQAEGSVFTTNDRNSEVVWVMTRFDDHALEVAYAQVLPKMWAGEIIVRLHESSNGRTQATVTYKRTALSAEGDQGVLAFGRHFPDQREHWQNAINRRLRALAGQHEHN